MTKAIVAIRKSTVPANTFDKLATQPKAFHDYIMGALGAANFSEDMKLRPLRPKDIEWGTETTQEVRAFAMIRNAKRKHAFFRTETHGVFVRTAERDEELTIVNLPVETILAEGNAKHKKLALGRRTRHHSTWLRNQMHTNKQSRSRARGPPRRSGDIRQAVRLTA